MFNMAYSKAFPKNVKGSSYPVWQEVYLTVNEEEAEEENCRIENISKMKECISDAKEIIELSELKRYQSDMISLAIALFDKRASHSVYWKESRAKDKFDSSIKTKS